jgi:short-subunit dehydrogenase
MKAAQARVLLTGATGGIGQAMAQALVRGGACVMLAGRRDDTLKALARRIDPGAAHTVCQQADLLQPQGVASLAAAAAHWGCNVVVHAAGIPAFGPLQAIPARDMGAVLQTNLLAPMLLTQALLAHLCAQPQAQVICVGSALGRIGLPGYSVYSASKFGLRGFAEALRRELADTAVRVQYLGPRSTRTAFNSAGVDAYNQATGTAVDAPERVAGHLMALLASGAAERFIGFPETLAVRINGAVPSWLDGSFKTHRRTLAVLPST